MMNSKARTSFKDLVTALPSLSTMMMGRERGENSRILNTPAPFKGRGGGKGN